MYARVTTFNVDPARLAELAEKIAKVTSLAKALPGVVDIYVLWRSDGRGVLTAIYESKTAADAAVARIQALWGALAGMLAQAPRTDVYENVVHIAG